MTHTVKVVRSQPISSQVRYAQMISAIRELDEPEETRGKKILHVRMDDAGNHWFTAVYHREINWSWFECIKSWFGESSYSLQKVIRVLRNERIFDAVWQFQNVGLMTILNKRVQTYNRTHWFSSIKPIEITMDSL